MVLSIEVVFFNNVLVLALSGTIRYILSSRGEIFLGIDIHENLLAPILVETLLLDSLKVVILVCVYIYLSERWVWEVKATWISFDNEIIALDSLTWLQYLLQSLI